MVRGFDADRQEWVGSEQEQRISDLHRRDAARQRQALLVCVTVLAACGLGFGTWALGWKDEPRPVGVFLPRERGQQPGDSAGGGGPSPSVSPTAPPTGYELQGAAEYFRVAVPQGWTGTPSASQYGMDVVNFRNADGSRRLLVYQVQEGSPADSLEQFIGVISDSEGFRQLSFHKSLTDDEGRPAAELEYVTDHITGEKDIGRWHVVDHRFQSADGNLYALASYGPDADGRNDERKVLDTALQWFCPPHTECPGPPAG